MDANTRKLKGPYEKYEHLKSEPHHAKSNNNRPLVEAGKDSPSANKPTKTPVIIEATAAHVETTTALPFFKPLVCHEMFAVSIIQQTALIKFIALNNFYKWTMQGILRSDHIEKT